MRSQGQLGAKKGGGSKMVAVKALDSNGNMESDKNSYVSAKIKGLKSKMNKKFNVVAIG